MALEGSTAFVGAPMEQRDLMRTPGTVYVYELSNDRWTERQRLDPSSGLENDAFGSAIAVKADVAVLGAPAKLEGDGKAYIFERDSTGDWAETQILSRAAPSKFGEAIAFDGDTLAIGDSVDGDYYGSVTIYTHSADTWVEVQRIRPNDPAKLIWFGDPLLLRGDTLFVGSPFNGTTGAVYVFARDASGTWSQKQKITPAFPENARFGQSLGRSADWLVVGAPGGTVNVPQAGAVYAFQQDPTGAWIEQQKFASEKTAEYGFFGPALLLSSDNQLIVGDPHNDDTGSAHLFELGEPPPTGGAGTGGGGSGIGGASGGDAGTGHGGAPNGTGGTTPESGGASTGGATGGAQPSGGAASVNPAAPTESDSGCGCATVGKRPSDSLPFLLAGCLITILRRRNRTRR